jgi:putative membrane protein
MTHGAVGIGDLGRPEGEATMKPWLLGWMGLWIMAGWAWHAVAGEIPMPPVEPRIIPPTLSWASIFTSVVYGLLGLILLLIGYYIYEIITPFSVKEELISHRNPAVGMVVAAFILGMAIVIAAAII